MLYLIHSRNSELAYQGGQDPIIHLQADLNQVIKWANAQNPSIGWAFTTSNASSNYFEDFNDLNDLNDLDKIDWNAVQAKCWQGLKEGKQAKFLLEKAFPWHLIEHIGVHSRNINQQFVNILQVQQHRPQVTVEQNWYY